MATGITALTKTLIGVEQTAGSTGDAPSTHWRGMGTIADRAEYVFPTERIGILGSTLRSYVPRTGSEITLEGDATFEQLPYIFGAAFYYNAPSTDSGSGYIWAWNAQTVSTDPISSSDLTTLVIQTGDNIGAEIVRYAYVESFTLSGKQGEGLQVSATLKARAPEVLTMTAVSTTDLENEVETVLFSNVSLYIDSSTNAIGTTQKSETIMDATLNINATGWVEIAAKDGRTDFSGIKRIDDEMTLDVAFEHNSIAVSEKSAWRAQTERAVRLKFTGTALTSAGTYANKTLIIDAWGKWESFGADGLEDRDGDNMYSGTLRIGRSVAAGGKKLTITVVNQLAALP